MKRNLLEDSYRFLRIIFLLLFLSACSSIDNNVSVTSSPHATLTQAIESSPTPMPSMMPTIVVAHPPNPTPPPTLPPSPLLELIKTEYLATDCSAPCMFDFIPGQTKADEIPTMLESLQADGIIQDFYLDEHLSGTSYVVIFPLSLGMDIQIDEVNNSVVSVGFGTGYRVISLMDVIERFGEPTYVIPTVATSYLTLYLYYPDEHVFVETRSDFISDKLITPDMAIKTLVYETSEESRIRFSTPNRWTIWEGYKSFEYYFTAREQLEEQTPESDSIE